MYLALLIHCLSDCYPCFSSGNTQIEYKIDWLIFRRNALVVWITIEGMDDMVFVNK